MLKMIIACRRNPALSRPEFFSHLRHVHWPLIQAHPVVRDAIGGYVQNHAWGEAEGLAAVAPFPLAGDRDSVIELWFDDAEGLDRLVQAPGYLEAIRPDEATFNDLASNIMVKTAPHEVFRASSSGGRCKRFDFIRRKPGVDREVFLAGYRHASRQAALDPRHTAVADRQVDHEVLEQGPGQGFGAGAFDVVREVWASTPAALLLASWPVADADSDASFSVYGTEFTMIAPRHETASRDAAEVQQP